MKCLQAMIQEKELLIHSLEKNMREKLAYIPSKLDEMEVFEQGHALIINSHLPTDTLNTVYGGVITEAQAKWVFDYYQNFHLPMAWWIGPSSKTIDSDAVLSAAGFSYAEHDVGMVCDLTQVGLEYVLPSNLEIQIAESASSFADFGAVLASVFVPEDEFVKAFYKKLAQFDSASLASLKLFVGYEGSQPVAVSALFLTECAGFFDIATRPEFQQKGHGSALFYAALRCAKDLGYEVGVLQASPDGLNIYKRFGFEALCELSVWSNGGG